MTTYPTPQMMVKARMPVIATARTRGTRRASRRLTAGVNKKASVRAKAKGTEKIAGEEEDEDGDREHEEGSSPGKLGGSSMRHTTSRRADGWTRLPFPSPLVSCHWPPLFQALPVDVKTMGFQRILATMTGVSGNPSHCLDRAEHERWSAQLDCSW